MRPSRSYSIFVCFSCSASFRSSSSSRCFSSLAAEQTVDQTTEQHASAKAECRLSPLLWTHECKHNGGFTLALGACKTRFGTQQADAMICCKACQRPNLSYRRPPAVLQCRAHLDAARLTPGLRMCVQSQASAKEKSLRDSTRLAPAPIIHWSAGLKPADACALVLGQRSSARCFHFCPPWSATAGSTLSHGAARRAAAAKPLLVGAGDPAHCHAAWHRSSACPADSCAVRAKRHAGSGQPAATIGHGNTTSRRRQHEDA